MLQLHCTIMHLCELHDKRLAVIMTGSGIEACVYELHGAALRCMHHS